MPLKAIQVLSHRDSGIMKHKIMAAASFTGEKRDTVCVCIGRPFLCLMLSLKLAESGFDMRDPWRISSHDLYDIHE